MKLLARDSRAAFAIMLATALAVSGAVVLSWTLYAGVFTRALSESDLAMAGASSLVLSWAFPVSSLVSTAVALALTWLARRCAAGKYAVLLVLLLAQLGLLALFVLASRGDMERVRERVEWETRGRDG